MKTKLSILLVSFLATSPLAAQESATEELQIGQPYILESHGDWAVRCLRSEDAQDPCQMYQLIADGNGGNLAEFTLQPTLSDGADAPAAIATIVAPLETLLMEGFIVQVDDNDARRYSFSYCNRGGCVVRVALTPEEVEEFRKGAEALVRLVPVASPDSPVVVPMSLSGFTAGYNAVREIMSVE